MDPVQYLNGFYEIRSRFDLPSLLEGINHDELIDFPIAWRSKNLPWLSFLTEGVPVMIFSDRGGVTGVQDVDLVDDLCP
jgi:hypothetical protein